MPRLSACAAALAVLCFVRAAPATTVRSLDLEALSGEADRIFVGRVIATESGHDPNGLPSTWTTFAVDESVKGALPPRLTIKQLASGGAADGAIFRVPGLPAYREGETVLLFLNRDSSAGFTSPVGLPQGCFRVSGSGADATVENDVGNMNLAPSTPGDDSAAAGSQSTRSASMPDRHPMRLDDVLTRVRALGAERGR